MYDVFHVPHHNREGTDIMNNFFNSSCDYNLRTDEENPCDECPILKCNGVCILESDPNEFPGE